MTTCRSETFAGELERWAALQLKVDPGATAATVRAAFLRQVKQENGVPAATARQALLILTRGPRVPVPGEAFVALEECLQREVDDFAGRFFALPPAARRREWDSLEARSQQLVRVDARLTVLQPGLDVELPRIGNHDPFLFHLVGAIAVLFVLRPQARAAQRQELLVSMGESRHVWAAAAARLRELHPDIAALEPELISRLADAEVRQNEKHQLNRAMRKAAGAAQTSGGGDSKALLWVAVVVVGVLLRLLGSGLSSRQNTPVVPPMPRFNQPEAWRNLKPDDLGLKKLEKEINEAISKKKPDDPALKKLQKENPALWRLLTGRNPDEDMPEVRGQQEPKRP